MSSGQFRQVGEKGSGGQLREEEWRLGGGEGSREFTMREWEDKGRWGKMTREVEGGEWDLRSGRGWGEEGMSCSDGGDTSVRRRNRLQNFVVVMN